MATRQPQSDQSRSSSPGLHYLGALVITAIVTGLAFLIADPVAKWIVVATAALMDVTIILVALKPAPRSGEE